MSAETDKITGNVKQAAGDLTGNDKLKHEGKMDELAGKLKTGLNDAVDKVRDAVHHDKAKDAPKA